MNDRASFLQTFAVQVALCVLVSVPAPLIDRHRPMVAAAVLTAAMGSSCGEEACGLFGELFKKLEVRAVPGIRVEDQPGIR
jgi:hypothetical protein